MLGGLCQPPRLLPAEALAPHEQALTLGQVHLVDEAGQHVAVLDVEVVVGPEDVSGDDGGESAAVLLEVGPAKAPRLLRPLPRDRGPTAPALASWMQKPKTREEGCEAWEPCPGNPRGPPPFSCRVSAGHVGGGPVLHVDHPLGIGVAKIAAVRRPVVDLGEQGRPLLSWPRPRWPRPRWPRPSPWSRR